MSLVGYLLVLFHLQVGHFAERHNDKYQYLLYFLVTEIMLFWTMLYIGFNEESN